MNKLNNLSNELPDYIRENITDAKLKSEIENELKNNPDFAKEYNRLKEIILSLAHPKSDDAPDNYFLNLPDRIIERLGSENVKNHRNIVEKYFLNWKFAAVAAVVIIFMLIVKPFSGSFDNKNEFADSVTKTKNNVVQNDEQIKYTVGIENFYDEIEEIQGDFTLNGNNSPFRVQNFKGQTHKQMKTGTDNNGNVENADDIYEFLIQEEDDESGLPSEEMFMRFSPEEQNKILEQIENLKI